MNSINDLHDLCENYINETPENKLREDVFDACSNYFFNCNTKSELDLLISFFKINL